MRRVQRPKIDKRDGEHAAAWRRERRSQLRGLLVLSALVLLWVLWHADRRAIFHAGWWRI